METKKLIVKYIYMEMQRAKSIQENLEDDVQNTNDKIKIINCL